MKDKNKRIGLWYKDELVFETYDEDFDIRDIEIMETKDSKHWEKVKNLKNKNGK